MTRRTTGAPRTTAGAVVRKPNRLWRLGFGVALAVQLIVVYSPGGPAVAAEIDGLDKVIHVVIFAAPALAALMLGISPWWALGTLALHAPVSELVQHLALPYRGGDVLDVLADLGGIALGWWAYLVWSRRQP